MHRFSVHFWKSTEIWTNTEILCRVDTLVWIRVFFLEQISFV